MALLFLTFGPTHSGKTTFGAQLRSALGDSAKFIHIDNDAVDAFVQANYNNLRTDPEVLARRSPGDPDLRLLIPQLVADYALREGYSAIATAAHPKRIIRQSYCDIARKNGADVVLLLFRVSDEQAARRIRQNQRDTAILDVSAHGASSSDFQKLFDNQKAIFEEPTPTERQSYFKVFEITEANAEDMLQKAIELAKQHGAVHPNDEA